MIEGGYRESFSLNFTNLECMNMENSGVVWSFDFSFANGYTNYPAVGQIFKGDCKALTCVKVATTKQKGELFVEEGYII